MRPRNQTTAMAVTFELGHEELGSLAVIVMGTLAGGVRGCLRECCRRLRVRCRLVVAEGRLKSSGSRSTRLILGAETPESSRVEGPRCSCLNRSIRSGEGRSVVKESAMAFR